MKYRAKVEVRLKQGLSNPEGEASAESLRDLGYAVSEVGISKIFYIHLTASSLSEAHNQVDEMCKKLLANPVKENYEIEVEKIQ